MPTAAQARTTYIAQRTIAKFLNAAEEVFGQHGYEGTTIRAIAKAARGNLGTLQHYWGSKKLLFRDLFERRFRPLEREYMRRIENLESRIGSDGKPDPEDVLRVVVETIFLVNIEDWTPFGFEEADQRARKRFHALYGRALMDASPEVISELNRIFSDSVVRFVELMRRACSDLSAAELDWRINCIIGAQVFSQVYAERVGRYYVAEVEVDDAVAAEWVIHCLVQGVGGAPSRKAIPAKVAAAAREPRRKQNSTVRSRARLPCPAPACAWRCGQ